MLTIRLLNDTCHHQGIPLEAFKLHSLNLDTRGQFVEMSYPLEDVRPMFELRGRNYVVTGAAQGIGFAVTRAICEMGGNVAVMDIQDKPVDEKMWNSLSQSFGTKTVYIQTDVTKEESLNAAFARAVQELGSIDGLVPAAGIAIDKPFIEQTWEEFTRIQEINVGVSFAALSESSLMPSPGPGHIFRGSTGYKTIFIARERRQHRPHRLAVKSHCASRLVSLPVENGVSLVRQEAKFHLFERSWTVMMRSSVRDNLRQPVSL